MENFIGAYLCPRQITHTTTHPPPITLPNRTLTKTHAPCGLLLEPESPGLGLPVRSRLGYEQRTSDAKETTKERKISEPRDAERSFPWLPVGCRSKGVCGQPQGERSPQPDQAGHAPQPIHCHSQAFGAGRPALAASYLSVVANLSPMSVSRCTDMAASNLPRRDHEKR